MIQPRQISFHPQHHPRKNARDRPELNSPCIYTAPFDSEHTSPPTNHSSFSRLSLLTEQSKSTTLFVNPRPIKAHPSKMISLDMPR